MLHRPPGQRDSPASLDERGPDQLEGREFDEQAVAALSPYIWHHINRFGHYQFDLTQHSPPIEYDLHIPTKKRQEKPPGQAALAKRKKKPKKKRKKTVARQMKLFEGE